MNFLKALTVNYYINVMLTAWFLAQLSKTLLTLFFEKSWFWSEWSVPVECPVRILRWFAR